MNINRKVQRSVFGQMNKIAKIVLISVGIGGASFLGGISLINIGITVNNEAPKPVSTEEISKQSDIENRNDGLQAMNEGDYFSALVFFHAISDQSESVTNKDELIQDAALGYLTDILEKTDGELDYENFNQAKIYLEEAISLMPNNQKLNQEYNHVLLREELYYIMNTDTEEKVLEFICGHWDDLKNDTYVVEKFSDYRKKYVDNIKQQVGDLIESSDYENAKQIVSSAKELLGTYGELEEIQEQIQNAEIKEHIETMSEQQQWRELILYLDNNSTIRKVYDSDYNVAISNYKNDVIKQAEEAIEVYDYGKVKSILSLAYDILYGDDEYIKLYDQYKNYNSSVLRFCPVINGETVEYGEAYDISGGNFSDVIKIKHNQTEKTVVFRLPNENYSRLSGTFFICQEKNYPYDEEDIGETSVCFYDENDNLIKRYEGITYMNSVPFDISVGNVKYLTMNVIRTTFGNVILGIRDGQLNN